MAEETLIWFAGIDWGSERHQACVLDAQGNILGERGFPHSGAGLAELGDWLHSIAAAADTVAVGIEVPHGPVVDTLVDRGFVVHAINPKQLDRLRDRFSVAGAKDDRRDAYVLADGVRTDRRLFRRLHVADPRLVELRAWSRLAEELKEEQRRLSNRVGQQLWRYYPQMQKLTDDLAAPWFLELWTIAPTPAKARQLRKPTVERLLRQHRIRRVDADTVLRTLREPPIQVAEGVSEAASTLAGRSSARCQSRAEGSRAATRQALPDDWRDRSGIGRMPSTTGHPNPQVPARYRPDQPGGAALGSLWTAWQPGLSGAADVVWGRAGHSAQR
jgi:hypothetical protein